METLDRLRLCIPTILSLQSRERQIQDEKFSIVPFTRGARWWRTR